MNFILCSGPAFLNRRSVLKLGQFYCGVDLGSNFSMGRPDLGFATIIIVTSVSRLKHIPTRHFETPRVFFFSLSCVRFQNDSILENKAFIDNNERTCISIFGGEVGLRFHGLLAQYMKFLVFFLYLILFPHPQNNTSN